MLIIPPSIETVSLLVFPLSRVDLASEYFASHLEPFLTSRTSHFMHEFVSFAKSPYDVIAYDGKVRYNWPDGYQVPPAAVGGASDRQDSSSSNSVAGMLYDYCIVAYLEQYHHFHILFVFGVRGNRWHDTVEPHTLGLATCPLLRGCPLFRGLKCIADSEGTHL